MGLNEIALLLDGLEDGGEGKNAILHFFVVDNPDFSVSELYSRFHELVLCP